MKQALIARTHPGRPFNKSALLRAEKTGLWRTFTPHHVPAGDQAEYSVAEQPGQFVGTIRVPHERIPMALDFTRNHLAICLATAAPLQREALERLELCNTRSEIFRWAISRVDGETIVLRAWGEFDDHEIAAEAFVSAAVGDQFASGAGGKERRDAHGDD